jgi:hypothetical protein
MFLSLYFWGTDYVELVWFLLYIFGTIYQRNQLSLEISPTCPPRTLPMLGKHITNELYPWPYNVFFGPPFLPPTSLFWCVCVWCWGWAWGFMYAGLVLYHQTTSPALILFFWDWVLLCGLCWPEMYYVTGWLWILVFLPQPLELLGLQVCCITRASDYLKDFKLLFPFVL